MKHVKTLNGATLNAGATSCYFIVTGIGKAAIDRKSVV